MAEYIEREPMIEEIQRLIDNVSRNFPKATETELIILKGKYEAFMEYIKEQPVADVQPVKRGEWEKKSSVGVFRCSLCQHIFMLGADEINEYHFCPCCGADMRGDRRAENDD